MIKILMNYEEIDKLAMRVDKFIDESIQTDPNGEQYIDDGGDCKNIGYFYSNTIEKINKISEIEKDINRNINIINRIMQDSKAKTLGEASAILRKELVENYNYPNKDDIEIKKCCDCHNHLKYGSNDYNAGYHLDTNDCYEEYEDEEDPLVYF